MSVNTGFYKNSDKCATAFDVKKFVEHFENLKSSVAIKKNVAIRRPKKDTSKGRKNKIMLCVLSSDKATEFLKGIKNIRHRLIFSLLYEIGGSISTARSLRFIDIVPDRNNLSMEDIIERNTLDTTNEFIFSKSTYAMISDHCNSRSLQDEDFILAWNPGELPLEYDYIKQLLRYYTRGYESKRVKAVEYKAVEVGNLNSLF